MASLEGLLAEDLRAHEDAAVDAVLVQVAETVPSLLASPDDRRLARASSSGILRAFAAILELGLDRGFHAPPEPVAYGRHLARRGVPLADILRSYRIGQQVSFSRAGVIAAQADEPDPAGAVSRVGVLSFAFADAVMSEVTQAYDDEREHLIGRRDAVIRAFLAGEEVELAAVERAVGHRLDGPRVALHAWRADGGGDVVAELRAMLPRPSLLASVNGAAAGWIVAPDDDVAAALAGQGLHVALSDSVARPADYARARGEALRASRCAHPGLPLVRHADVALLALLLAEPDAASTWANAELGALADPAMEPIRATVAAFYASGQDRTRTAHALGMHRNTVTRHLARAADILGSPLDDRATERAAALRVLAAS